MPPAREISVRAYQSQVPLTPLLSNLVAEVSASQPRWEAVLRAYVSQAASIECTYRQRRYSALLHGVDGVIEAFWEMSASRYVALHVDPPTNWPRAFRGLRNFPLADPMAFIAGRNERRRIRGVELAA
jgi:hypothetical protein